MDISIGIVGLPNTGKSTLFNALTKKSVPAENFPFCTIDPSVGVVQVPDERLEKLAEMSRSQKIVPTVIEFVDIAGLVRGASAGEGLGNAFLSHIRGVDAILHTVRCFTDDTVLHVDGSVDPIRDIEVIETELLLADVQIVERRLEKIEKEVKRGDKEAMAEKELLTETLTALRTGTPASALALDGEKKRNLKALGLLTVRAMMYVCNVGEQNSEDMVNRVREIAARTGSETITVAAHTERELSDMSAEDAALLREEMARGTEGIDTIIQIAYKTLGCISFLTTGEKESRAWMIEKGSTAPKAAGAIHTDFEKNFIRAEVIPYKQLIGAGSYADARAAGLLRLEGKEYIVRDGDVITFRTGA